jgi:hypothetical protein
MAVNLPNAAGLRLEMSASQHYDVLNRSTTRDREPPRIAVYEQLFTSHFDECMKLPGGAFNEDNWDLFERVLAPIYFSNPRWVPDVPEKFDVLYETFCQQKDKGICFCLQLSCFPLLEILKFQTTRSVTRL